MDIDSTHGHYATSPSVWQGIISLLPWDGLCRGASPNSNWIRLSKGEIFYQNDLLWERQTILIRALAKNHAKVSGEVAALAIANRMGNLLDAGRRISQKIGGPFHSHETQVLAKCQVHVHLENVSEVMLRYANRVAQLLQSEADVAAFSFNETPDCAHPAFCQRDRQ